jgi:hypothetical protein
LPGSGQASVHLMAKTKAPRWFADPDCAGRNTPIRFTRCSNLGSCWPIAVDRGYKNADALMANDDLLSLRHSSRFRELVTELQHPAARVPTH